MDEWAPLPGRFARIALVLLPFAFSGCYTMAVPHFIPLAPPIAPRPSQILEIPVAVGIYFPPVFLGHGLSERARRALGPVSTVGDANRRFLEAVFAQLFETVVPVPGPPPLEGEAGRLAAVIVPAIESFDFHVEATFFHGATYTATVAYGLSLLSPQGGTIATWTVRGSWEIRGIRGARSRYETFGVPTERAMRQAGEKIVADFREVPGVQEWLDRIATSRAISGPGALR